MRYSVAISWADCQLGPHFVTWAARGGCQAPSLLDMQSALANPWGVVPATFQMVALRQLQDDAVDRGGIN